VNIKKPIVGFFESLDNKLDVDFYKIENQKSDNSYEIIISPVPEVDIKATFYDNKRRILFTLDENGEGEGEKLWEFTFFGEFIYIKLESKRGENKKIPYIINFVKKEINSYEIEPNNSEKEAITIKLNDTKEAFISPQSDVDYYKLVFDNNQTNDFFIEIETLSNLDINFIIIEKKYGMIKTINSEGFGGTEISPYLASDKGDYFIKVSGKINPSDKKPPIYYISVKDVKSVNEEKEYLYEREINDYEPLATELINNIEMLGNLYPENDVDWFYFELYKKAISVDLTISDVKGVNFSIDIYDKDKNLIKSTNNNPQDKGEQISLKDVDTGRYFVKIYGVGNSRLFYKLYYYARY